MALRPGPRSARFWAELGTALLESELYEFSHWDRARGAAEDSSCAGQSHRPPGWHWTQGLGLPLTAKCYPLSEVRCAGFSELWRLRREKVGTELPNWAGKAGSEGQGAFNVLETWWGL